MKVESSTGQGKGGKVAGLGSEGEKRRGFRGTRITC
jgi:hypothetical protein